MKADDYDPTLKHVIASPVKLMTVEGSIEEVLIPDDSMLVGRGVVGVPLRVPPKYIMGPNPIDPENDICYALGERINGLMRCPTCSNPGDIAGFLLEVPEGWEINAVVQCANCGTFHFISVNTAKIR